jgi:plasmid stabilization system protein ParE
MPVTITRPLAGSDLIFYIPLADGVEIVRVLHGARDLDALFNPDSED